MIRHLGLAVLALAACRGGSAGGNAGTDHAISCARVADATLALFDREPHSMSAGLNAERRADVRENASGQCEVGGWDDVERQCILAARDVEALVDCYIVGARRRHPEWRWR